MIGDFPTASSSCGEQTADGVQVSNSKNSIAISNVIYRVVDVRVAHPRAYDVQRTLVLLGFCALAGILMLPSIVALLSLTGLL